MKRTISRIVLAVLFLFLATSLQAAPYVTASLTITNNGLTNGYFFSANGETRIFTNTIPAVGYTHIPATNGNIATTAASNLLANLIRYPLACMDSAKWGSSYTNILITFKLSTNMFLGAGVNGFTNYGDGDKARWASLAFFTNQGPYVAPPMPYDGIFYGISNNATLLVASNSTLTLGGSTNPVCRLSMNQTLSLLFNIMAHGNVSIGSNVVFGLSLSPDGSTWTTALEPQFSIPLSGTTNVIVLTNLSAEAHRYANFVKVSFIRTPIVTNAVTVSNLWFLRRIQQ